MAVKQSLLIEIGPDGKLKIKTEGFKGNECETELKPIEQAVGKVTERSRTSEYYQANVTNKSKVTTRK